MKKYISKVDTIVNTIYGKIKLTKDQFVDDSLAIRIPQYVECIEVTDSVVDFFENNCSIYDANKENNVECIVKNALEQPTKGKNK